MIPLLLCSLALAQDASTPHTPSGTDLDSTPDLPGPTADGGEAIINGEAAAEDDYPMAGGMLMSATLSIWGYVVPVDTFVCSSTLIAPDVVLLAAHCVDDYSFTYGLGDISDKELWWTRQADLTTWDGTSSDPALPEDAVEVIGYVKHESFSLETLGSGVTRNDDIALLFLAEAQEDAPRAYLPSAEEGAALAEGDEVVVVGWGQQSATGWGETPPPGSYAVKQMGVSTIDELGEFEFQVGAETEDVRKCHGDSGGPSFATVQASSTDKLRVVGVTSHAYDSTDCNSTGGVDTRVDAYLEWIDTQMIAACEDGTRVWCDVPGILTPDNDPDSLDNVSDADGDGDGDGDSGGKGCTTVPFLPGMLALALSGLVAVTRRRTLA